MNTRRWKDRTKKSRIYRGEKKERKKERNTRCKKERGTNEQVKERKIKYVYDTVWEWKNSVNATVGGVGILIGPSALKSLKSIERKKPRMMVATFKGNPRARIIICYSPTNVSEETELVAFYDELSSLVRRIPKHNLLVIGGDMNAQIRKNGNNKYSLHNTSNRNGQNLTDFMIDNRLTRLNTNYKKREGKLWTYTYANNN